MRRGAVFSGIRAALLWCVLCLPLSAQDAPARDGRVTQALDLLNDEDWAGAEMLAAAALEDATDPQGRLDAAEVLAELDFLLADTATALAALVAVDAQIVELEGWQAPRRIRVLDMLATVQGESGDSDAARLNLLRLHNLAVATQDNETALTALDALIPLELARGDARTAALFASDLFALASASADGASELAARALILRARAHLRLDQPGLAIALVQYAGARDSPDAAAFHEELAALAAETGTAEAALARWTAEAATLAPHPLARETDALLAQFLSLPDTDRDNAAALARAVMAAADTGDGNPVIACGVMIFRLADTAPAAALPWIACLDDFPLEYVAAQVDLSSVLDHSVEALVADPDVARKRAMVTRALGFAEVLQGPNAAATLRLRLKRAEFSLYQWDYADARRDIAAVVAAAGVSGTPVEIRYDARALLGRLLAAQNDLAGAETAYRAAADILRAAGLSQDGRWVLLLSAMADVAMARGDTAGAQALARQALANEIALNGTATDMTMQLRIALGATLMQGGDRAGALAEFEKAQAHVAAHPGADLGTGVAWQLSHATLLRGLGRQAEAAAIMAQVARALDARPELTRDPLLALTIYSALSKAAYDDNDLPQAAQYADKALDILPDDAPDRIDWLDVKARAALAENRNVAALALLREVGNALRKPGRADPLATRVTLPVYIEAALRVAQEQGGEGAFAYLDEAFQVAQRLNALSAGSAIAAASARWDSEPVLAQTVRQLQDTESEVAALNVSYSRALARGENGSARGADLRAAEARYQMLRDRVARDFPDYARAVDPQPLSVAEVAAWLAPDEVVLIFATSDQVSGDTYFGSTVLAVSDTGIIAGSTLNAGALREIAAELRCQAALTDPRCAVVRGQTRGAFSMDPSEDEPADAAPGFDLVLAHAAYQALLAPVEPALTGKTRLIVVPDTTLVSVPFHTLVRVAPGPDTTLRDAGWLIRDMSVVVVPTLASLDALRRQPAHKDEETGRFLGVGDPLIGAQVGGALPFACDQVSAQIASLAPAPDAPVMRGTLGDPGALAALAALPDTRCELQAAAAYFGAGSTLLLQQNATETAIRALNATGALAGYSTISFATHGLIAGEVGDYDAGIVLTPPAVATADDDGILTTGDIAQLTLNADMVLLSACNTAAGSGKSDEGLSGLASAFFYAGARGLLVSHWPVYSDAATRLTTDMLARRGADPRLGYGHALRLTMLGILDDPASDARQIHPAYWAPFMVVGEGAARP